MGIVNLCRIVFEFVPGSGGSAVHTLETSCHMADYVNRQFIIAPAASQDTANLDNSFPFNVCRIGYCRFELLGKIKMRFLHWLPVAPLVHISFGLGAIRVIIALNNRYGIDIIQAHGVGMGPVGTIAGWIIRKPVVWMMHGTCLAYSRICGVLESITTVIFKPRHLFVADDGSPAPEKFARLLKNRVTVVHHAIDTDHYKPLPKPARLLANVKRRKNLFIVFSPHSLIPVKGQEYAIRAFAHLVHDRNITGAVMIITGTGALEERLKQLVKSLSLTDCVYFLRSIPKGEMREYYALSDVVLATSMYSNMNRVTQEAMACAKPVVAFNSGGTNRVLTDGQTGLMAEPGNTSMLANKLELIYRNGVVRENIGKRAREFIVRERNWKKRIQKELAVYHEMLEYNVS
jgi:glycosyltransferase involved in cell wall biosynthesis